MFQFSTHIMYSELVLFFSIFRILFAMFCSPRYHYWRPFYGAIPKDAFVAATDPSGYQRYIAKLILNGDKTYPAELACDHVVQMKGSTPIRHTEFVDVLCSKEPNKLIWKWVNTTDECEIENFLDTNCLVDGSFIFNNQHKPLKNIYIGRTYHKTDHNYMIGSVELKAQKGVKSEIVVVHEWRELKYHDFHVLTYPERINKRFKPYNL